MKGTLLLLGAGGALFAFVACGSDASSTSTDGGVDAREIDGGSDGATADSSTDSPGSLDGGGDVGATDTGAIDTGIADSKVDVGEAGRFPINGCVLASFDDHTAAADPRVINGPSGTLPVQWSIPCMQIKAGQSVTWKATFANHPLESLGGDTPSPIVDIGGGLTVTYAFPNAGLFGFDCVRHGAAMQGAILVDP